MRTSRTIFLVLLLTLSTLLAAATARAGVPQLIHYQGTLTNTSGQLVADGQYNVEFRIYDVPTGGTPLWIEPWDGTTTPISTVGGVFNVLLGTNVPFAESFFADHPATYLAIRVGSDSEMLPRQRIASVGYAFSAGNGVPKGAIVMWSGAVNAIPAGWALCDGTNGTPDLKEKFIVGAHPGLPVGMTGGSVNHSHAIGSHTHPVTGSTGAGGDHTHHIDAVIAHWESGDWWDAVDGEDDDEKVASEYHQHHLVTDTWGASTGNHLHAIGPFSTGDAGTAGSGSTDSRPPFYALAFIMKL